jgi:hypothetical protein
MKPKSKIVPSYSMIVAYLTCPHCKKLIFTGYPEDVKKLKKWKKQKK